MKYALVFMVSIWVNCQEQNTVDPPDGVEYSAGDGCLEYVEDGIAKYEECSGNEAGVAPQELCDSWCDADAQAEELDADAVAECIDSIEFTLDEIPNDCWADLTDPCFKLYSLSDCFGELRFAEE